MKCIVLIACLTLASTAASAQGLGGLAQGLLAGQQFMYGAQSPRYYAPPAYADQAPEYQGPQFQTFSFPNGQSVRCATLGAGTSYQTTRCY